jgi:hypothetical protein
MLGLGRSCPFTDRQNAHARNAGILFRRAILSEAKDLALPITQSAITHHPITQWSNADSMARSLHPQQRNTLPFPPL